VELRNDALVRGTLDDADDFMECAESFYERRKGGVPCCAIVLVLKEAVQGIASGSELRTSCALVVGGELKSDAKIAWFEAMLVANYPPRAITLSLYMSGVTVHSLSVGSWKRRTYLSRWEIWLG
jgi:hypothetical protein